jgi:predicted metal-binding protein
VPETETNPVIHVCVTCNRPGEQAPLDARAGRRLHEAVLERARATDAKVRVGQVECMAQCQRGCTVAFSSCGKWSYLFGDLDPDIEGTADAILACAEIHAADPDGFIKLKSRPVQIRKGLLARIPPLPLES